MRRRLPAPVMTLVLALLAGAPAIAQEPRLPRTGPVAEAVRDGRPIAPEPFEAAPEELAREATFARTLDRARPRSGKCVGGWTVLDGVRYTRDGFVVAVGGSIVWLDVSVAGEHVGAPSDVAARIRRSFAFRASERS